MLGKRKKDNRIKVFALVFFSLSLLSGCGERLDLEGGKWEVTLLNEEVLGKPGNDFLYNAFYDGLIEKSYISFSGGKVDFPLGFNRIFSSSIQDNILRYEYSGNMLHLCGENTMHSFKIISESENSFCILDDSRQQLICFTRLSFPLEQKTIESLRLTGLGEMGLFDFYMGKQHPFLIYGEIEGKQDTLKLELEKYELDYINNIAKKITEESHNKIYNPKASDVSLYECEIKYMDGDRIVWKSNGYNSLPEIPFVIQALILNIEKIIVSRCPKCYEYFARID